MQKLNIYPLSLLVATLLSTTSSALPSLQEISSGEVNIANNNGHLNIEQTSSIASLDWSSFDLKEKELLKFQLPDENSITVNRIHSELPSVIAGNIETNGKLVISNQQGIVFTPTAVVSTHGLLATTATIDNHNINQLLNNSVELNNKNNSAEIANYGALAAEGGNLILIAPKVVNNGYIMGIANTISIGASEHTTVDFQGDGLIQFMLPEDNTTTREQNINNNGLIVNNNGNIFLNAQAASAAIINVINNNGVIHAYGKDNQTTITITAKDEINLHERSVISASGEIAGQINLGEDSAQSLTTNKITMHDHVHLTANTSFVGDGGKIFIKATDSLIAAGLISADAGMHGGNGGYIETSAKTLQHDKANIQIEAKAGKMGTWFVDPINITLDNYTWQAYRTSLNNNINVIISTEAAGSEEGNITLNTNLEWNSPASLSLLADNNIYLNEYSITNQHGAKILLKADRAGKCSSLGCGQVEITTGGINLSGTHLDHELNQVSGELHIEYKPWNNYSSPTTYTLNNKSFYGITLTDGASFYPYMLIYDYAGLKAMSTLEETESNNYALAKDINIDQSTPQYFSPIGVNSPFTGRFNGNGHKINRLRISATKDEYANTNHAAHGIAMFAHATNASIENLTLYSPQINATGTIAALVGIYEITQPGNYSINNITVENAVVNNGEDATNNFTDYLITGGVIGEARNAVKLNNIGCINSNIKNFSYVDQKDGGNAITEATSTGGIIGFANGAQTVHNISQLDSTNNSILAKVGTAGGVIGLTQQVNNLSDLNSTNNNIKLDRRANGSTGTFKRNLGGIIGKIYQADLQASNLISTNNTIEALGDKALVAGAIASLDSLSNTVNISNSSTSNNIIRTESRDNNTIRGGFIANLLSEKQSSEPSVVSLSYITSNNNTIDYKNNDISASTVDNEKNAGQYAAGIIGNITAIDSDDSIGKVNWLKLDNISSNQDNVLAKNNTAGLVANGQRTQITNSWVDGSQVSSKYGPASGLIAEAEIVDLSNNYVRNTNISSTVGDLRELLTTERQARADNVAGLVGSMSYPDDSNKQFTSIINSNHVIGSRVSAAQKNAAGLIASATKDLKVTNNTVQTSSFNAYAQYASGLIGLIRPDTSIENNLLKNSSITSTTSNLAGALISSANSDTEAATDSTAKDNLLLNLLIYMSDNSEAKISAENISGLSITDNTSLGLRSQKV